MSFKEAHDEETRGLFGKLRRNQFRGKESLARVPQEGDPATLVPFSFNGTGVFDDGNTMETLIFVPDSMIQIIEARVVVSIREFFAPATTVTSGGGATSGNGGAAAPTSGASSVSSSVEEATHRHIWASWESSTAGGFGADRYTDGDGNDFDLASAGNLNPKRTFGGSAHQHGISHTHTVTIGNHTHSTPAHSHDLSYGVFKEGMPATWGVRMFVYEWDGAAWDVIDDEVIGGDEVMDVDLGTYITGPGIYKIVLHSTAGNPNGGRLGCDLAGHIVGAMQALRP